MSKKAIQELMSGSQFDRLQAYYRYGEGKVQLSDEDTTYMNQVERAKFIWLSDNDEVLTRNKIIDEFACSQRHAYNVLQDAKKIWALTEEFDYGLQLMLLKRNIDKAYEQARSLADGKIYSAAFKADLEWVEKMRRYKELNKPDEPKTYHIIFHIDHKKIGVSDEMLAEFELTYKKEIEPFVKKKFKPTAADVAESIPFEDVE